MSTVESELKRQIEELKALTFKLQDRVEALEAGVYHRGSKKRTRQVCSSGSTSTRSSPRASADASPCRGENSVIVTTPSSGKRRRRQRRRPSLEDEGVRMCEMMMVHGADARVISRTTLVWLRKSVFGCFQDCGIFRVHIDAHPNSWEFSVRDGRDGERKEVHSRDRVIEVIKELERPVLVAREVCTIEDSECESAQEAVVSPTNAITSAMDDVQDWMMLD